MFSEFADEAAQSLLARPLHLVPQVVSVLFVDQEDVAVLVGHDPRVPVTRPPVVYLGIANDITWRVNCLQHGSVHVVFVREQAEVTVDDNGAMVRLQEQQLVLHDSTQVCLLQHMMQRGLVKAIEEAHKLQAVHDIVEAVYAPTVLGHVVLVQVDHH